MKKYELTAEFIEKWGKKLFRIKALISFESVEVGELGGYVEKEDNLAQTGNACRQGIEVIPIRISEENRINVKIKNQTETAINALGPCVSAGQQDALLADTKLKLYISHVVEDAGETVTRSNFTYAYRAYSIRAALAAFKEKTGKLPKYLELTAEINNSKDELVDKDGKETSVERSVEYDYAFTE